MGEEKREVRVGDTVRVHAFRHFYPGIVTRVTKTYIWIKFTPMTTAGYHITKRHRDIVLRDTEYY